MANFVAPADHWVKLKKSRKRDKYLYLARELKKKQKTVEHESEGDTNCNWRAWYGHQKIGTGTGGLGNNWTSGDHPNYSIAEIEEEFWRLEKTCCHSDTSKKP